MGGKVFAEENKESPRDIKKLFEEGIHSLVDKLLKVDDKGRLSLSIKAAIEKK